MSQISIARMGLPRRYVFGFFHLLVMGDLFVSQNTRGFRADGFWFGHIPFVIIVKF